MSAPPVHLLPDLPGHGVTLHASQVAAAVGADTLDLTALLDLAPQPVHVHVTDRLLGATGEETSARLVALGRRQPMTVTLHDVPQPGDGPVFARRVPAYAAVLAAARGWVVSSEHERALVRRHLAPTDDGAVVPLPVMPLPVPDGAGPRTCPADGPLVVGVLGWVYPGKGHDEVLRACAGVRRDRSGPVVLRALGRVAAGHDHLLDELAALAADLDVGLEVSGWVADADLPAALTDVDVPVAAHHHVSASGSMNSWVAARRRPLVTDGTYAREMAALRPGTLTLVDDDLAAALARAAADPAGTWLAPGVGLAPGLDEVAAAYRAWWSR
ncbi:hypothetical protein [Nocardioides sp. AX2bis]|uniref:hypothetical protein n=1 Tax=Nocardioides sp. AX2bis TaxID=2653157 RepID=UPI0012F3614E|nr:hypothetical protein [Nocardioides sp. AX2bis]VXB79266.1 conserved hypothetical protein [Nocardioides sp. AX2bis]